MFFRIKPKPVRTDIECTRIDFWCVMGHSPNNWIYFGLSPVPHSNVMRTFRVFGWKWTASSLAWLLNKVATR